MDDNKNDIVIPDSEWDRIDNMLEDTGARLRFLQSDAHDPYSDAIVALRHARHALKLARLEYESGRDGHHVPKE